MLKSKKEIAKLLGVSISTMNKYIKEGMPCYKLSDKLIRFKLEEVLEWIEQHKVS